MKITFVLPYAGLAGGIRVVAIYAERLKKRGHDVTVVSIPRRALTLRQKLKILLKEKRWPVQEHEPSHFDNVDVEHRILETCRPVMDNDVPDGDVVIATWWETAEWVAALSETKGRKFYFMQDYGAPGQELEKIVTTWRLPLHKITISQWLVDLIRSELGDVTVDLVPNAVDHTLFTAPLRGKQESPTAGFLYRSTPSKGADLVFRAYEEVLRFLPDFRLIAFGPESKPDFEHEQFFYFQLPPEKELPKIYASCDMWLFPSLLEGFGLPILEAMACRTPVIATPAGAAPELLEKGGGILLHDFSAESMARAMIEMAEMTERAWKVLSQQSYHTVAGYTWDDAAEQLENVLIFRNRW